MAKADKTPGAAAERLRADIDSGRTGDKVDFPDPSAAPLGTDEEAGGVTTPEEALEVPRRNLMLLVTGSQGERRAASAQLSRGK